MLYGLVGVLGIRIWMTNHVDLSLPINQMTAAVALIVGIADFTGASATSRSPASRWVNRSAARLSRHARTALRGRHPEDIPRDDIVG